MVPVVLGADMENVRKLLPPKSFLHVQNFTSPETLAQWMKYLSKNMDAYRYIQADLKLTMMSDTIFTFSISSLPLEVTFQMSVHFYMYGPFIKTKDINRNT